MQILANKQQIFRHLCRQVRCDREPSTRPSAGDYGPNRADDSGRCAVGCLCRNGAGPGTQMFKTYPNATRRLLRNSPLQQRKCFPFVILPSLRNDCSR